MEKITLYGVPISPYVRKTRLALAFKGISYKHIPVIPLGDDQPVEFKENSPLGKIPLLRVGENNYIPDSSVICNWLERTGEGPALLPSDNFAVARAQWFEEYADSHMTAIIGGHLFAEVVLATLLFKREPIQADIDAAINEEIPAIFDYIESELTGDYLLGESVTLADIAVGSVFVSMQHCNHYCDKSRWPKTSAYISRLCESDLFAPIIEAEKQMLQAMKG